MYKRVGNIETEYFIFPINNRSRVQVTMNYSESSKGMIELRGIEDIKDLIYSLKTIERKIEEGDKE